MADGVGDDLAGGEFGPVEEVDFGDAPSVEVEPGRGTGGGYRRGPAGRSIRVGE
jgi:hypothetical protein